MIIHFMSMYLPENLEKSILEAVHRSQFESLNEAMAEAARLLLKKYKRSNPARALTLDELDQEMLAEGLMSQLPNSAEDIDDEDEPPILIEGEPLSETI